MVDPLERGLVQEAQQDPGRGQGIAASTMAAVDGDVVVASEGVQVPAAKAR